MAPVTVAVVGTGSIAAVHLQALRALGDLVTVIAATDADPVRLREFCARHEIVPHFDSLPELLETATPDLVHVCTPPGAHAGQAVACLRAGSSVLVEKPPALSLSEMHAVAAAQGEHGPFFAAVFQHRFGSGARRLKKLINDGVLGRPLLAVCNTAWFRDQSYFDEPWRGRWDTEGGGPTMSHGIHQMDLLCYLLGDWSQVSAVARRQARQTQTEDLSLAHVTFASGAVASVVNSVLSPREESYLRFDFERATVELTHLYGYRDSDWRITPAPGAQALVSAAWQAGEHGVSSGHRAQFGHVLRALRGGSPPPVTLDDALRPMELVTAIYASAFQGRAIRHSDLTPSSPFYRSMDGDGTALNSLGDDAVIGPAAVGPAAVSPAATIAGSDGARR
jgi:predicted dehydrogenase